MILQTKTFNKNWNFEEAESITYAYLNVDEITKKYRECNRPNFETSEDEKRWGLARVKKMHLEVDEYIRRETNAANIEYRIGAAPFTALRNIAVIMLDDKNKNVTYVYDLNNTDTSIYLLNGKGQTVHTIAR